MSPIINRHNVCLILLSFMLLIASASSCVITDIRFPVPDTSSTVVPASTGSPPLVDVVFKVQVLPQTDSDQIIAIDILDIVTGIGLNPMRHEMGASGLSEFSTHISIPKGSTVLYRYVRKGITTSVEYTSMGQMVNFRAIQITDSAEIHDIVAAWSDIPFSGPKGRIQGKVLSASDFTPLGNILVIAGGEQTLTASDGSFMLDNLPTGSHQISALSLDGTYSFFQQEAIIGTDSTTPAEIFLSPTRLVDITFISTVPTVNVQGLPVRIIGNLYQLGNLFTDLGAGASTIASRAPALTMLTDGRYSITLRLPVGFDLHYKYSLGDGFWNSEQASSGGFLVRQIIIPDENTVIQDTVATWQGSDSAPVSFHTQIPVYTPDSDIVSIQFNPYKWMPPIPMWSVADDTWAYILFGPLNSMHTIGYRFCRNDQCGVADANNTAGEQSQGFPFSTSLLPQTFDDTVSAWAWLELNNGSTTVITEQVTPRGNDFLAGVEIQPVYSPTWQAYTTTGIVYAKQLGANTVFLTPTWSYSKSDPPIIEQTLGSDISSFELTQLAALIKQDGMAIGVFPQTKVLNGAEINPLSQVHSETWWNLWFEQYRAFIRSNAIIAEQTGAGVFIMGEPGLTGALPTGEPSGGLTNGVPVDAGDRWGEIIADVRTHFSGDVFWAVEYTRGNLQLPLFMNSLDGFYILWNSSLSTTNNPSTADIAAEFLYQLNTEIYLVYSTFGKRIYLGLRYPSYDGAVEGCVNSAPDCSCFENFDQPLSKITSGDRDLYEQADIYNAMFVAVNQSDWISGVITRGFYPPTVLQDTSSSIHGKPAADVIWYWFPRLLGNISN